MEADRGMLGQELLDGFGLMRRQVIKDNVNLLAQRARLISSDRRMSRCWCGVWHPRPCDKMRCTLDLLTPILAANLRTDQWVLRPFDFCCTFRHTLACTARVAVRARLPLC